MSSTQSISKPHPMPLQITCDVLQRMNSINIHESNGIYQEMVVSRIFATGKHVDDLTLGELREIVKSAEHEFNRIYWPESETEQ